VTEFAIVQVPDGMADPELDALIHALFQELCGRYPARVWSEVAWRAEVGPDGRFVAARLNGRLMGCCALHTNPDSGRDGRELKRMFVAPGARRLGLADALLDAVEETAASLGAPEVYLHTGTAQPEAIRLCESHGYAPIPLYGKYVGDPESLCYAKDVRRTRSPRRTGPASPRDGVEP
jgi:putative acetyltransferase